MAPPNSPQIDTKLKAAIATVLGIALFASVLALLTPPVRMAGGTVVVVTSAPVIAAAALGGPAAAAIMAIGTIECERSAGC